MFGEHYGQPPAWLWFSFQAMVVLLSHRELRSRPTGLFYVHSLKLNPQPPPGLPSQGFLLPPPSYSFGAHHSPWAELRAQKRFCSHTDLAPSIPCPNPCHTATWPFSPSLQRIKLAYLGALFTEILGLFSSKSPPTGVLI